jgi:hypothetical protein
MTPFAMLLIVTFSSCFVGAAIGFYHATKALSERRDPRAWTPPPIPPRLVEMTVQRREIVRQHGPVARFDRRFREARHEIMREYVERSAGK